MIAAALAFVAALAPMHGVVLATHNGEAIIRNDAITQTLASGTHRYRLSPHIALKSGVGIDGFLDRSTHPWTLRAPIVAAPFSPGMPDAGRVIPVDVGRLLPAATLIDQDGRRVALNRAFRGRVLLLSFIFTRCSDKTLCPAISGKYAYLQSHLDPSRFALAEITLDPPYDSPAVLRNYGAAYGANAARWKLLTGEGSEIAHLLNQFGIDSIPVSSNNFIHNDKLFLVTPQGKIAYVIQTAGWDPQDVVAQARSIAGMSSNPLERLKLSMLADVVALCGGSQFAGVVFLEIVLFFIIVVFVTGGLWMVGRIIWSNR